ncbi:MAG: DUF4268 domain-containing protein [Pseudomonadota bacterium]
MDAIGDLKTVNPRTLWPHEVSEFTPWLAREENIARLSEALGMELEVERTEVAVGPYSADIVARDTVTGRYVVVENQLGKTDHDHLGKLITYGATLDATTLVLIATTFSEEHQKAFDWLNEHTSEDLGFFGVRLEVWQIDESKPAVRFSVVSKPATAARIAARSSAEGQFTPTKRLQLEFWTEFEKRLREVKELPSTQTPRPQYWYNVALGRSGVHLACIASTWEKRIGVRVYMRSFLADLALQGLAAEREEIEREIGVKLKWNPFPDKGDKIILLERPADISLRDLWPEFLDWLVDYTLRFRRAFGPRVKALDLPSGPAKAVEA